MASPERRPCRHVIKRAPMCLKHNEEAVWCCPAMAEPHSDFCAVHQAPPQYLNAPRPKIKADKGPLDLLSLMEGR